MVSAISPKVAATGTIAASIDAPGVNAAEIAAAAGDNKALATMLSALVSSNAELKSSNAELLDRIQSLETDLSVASAGNTGSIKRASTLALELTGVESKMADEMLVLQNQLETDVLYFQDKAARGGWLVSDRYSRAHTRMVTSEHPIRLALGDEAFQNYLDASGQESSIIVNDILPESAAEGAGLLIGDVVHSYNGHRVFSRSELQLASTQGQRDDIIDLTVLRDDQLVALTISRGPLGIRANAGDDTALSSL